MIHYPKGYYKAKKEYRKEKIFFIAAIALILLGSIDF